MITLGCLLADLTLHRPTQSFIASHSRVLSLVVAPALLVLGLSLGSYPQEHEEYSNWSHWLHKNFVSVEVAEGQYLGSFLVPQGTDAPRRFTSVAIQLCALAIFLSSMLREALSHRWLLWLGHHSFAVYLVHGTVLRSLGIWVAYGMWPDEPEEPQEDGTPPESEYMHVRSQGSVYVAVAVFIALSYALAWAWMRWVDTACARVTRLLENLVFQDEDDMGEDEKARDEFRRGGHAGLEGGPRQVGYGTADLNSAVLPL